MHSEPWIEARLPDAVRKLSSSRTCPGAANTLKNVNLPGRLSVRHVLDELISVLFPGCHGNEAVPEGDLDTEVTRILHETAMAMKSQIRRTLEYQCKHDECRNCSDCESRAQEAVASLLKQLPEIQCVLQDDIMAAYEGDPAARSTMEVVMSYPGVYAVIVHRIAHVLYLADIPLIPRIMSEYAHSATGIDIHPGARIGPGFFIDHGTGVVIGETCTIGRRVKIYQGVTLGALSFEKDAAGRLIKGIKRHPDVGDHVVIYAQATILGGQTEIGADSVIGGNVWLTHSVPPGSRVYNLQPRPLIRQAVGEMIDLGAGI